MPAAQSTGAYLIFIYSRVHNISLCLFSAKNIRFCVVRRVVWLCPVIGGAQCKVPACNVTQNVSVDNEFSRVPNAHVTALTIFMRDISIGRPPARAHRPLFTDQRIQDRVRFFAPFHRLLQFFEWNAIASLALPSAIAIVAVLIVVDDEKKMICFTFRVYLLLLQFRCRARR